jgi:hypothetical protein
LQCLCQCSNEGFLDKLKLISLFSDSRMAEYVVWREVGLAAGRRPGRALNLMVESSKNVSLDYESLLPAAPVLSMLAVTFTYNYRVQAEQEVNHKWLILYSIAYYVTIFTDIIDHSYFTGYSKSFNCWTFISSHLAR